MENDNDIEPVETEETSHHSRIGGLGHKIIGEIESLAGVINADPLAQAEGEFNVEVGTVREELEENADQEDRKR